MVETAGWQGVDAGSKSAFEKLLRDLEGKGVRLIRLHRDELLEGPGCLRAGGRRLDR